MDHSRPVYLIGASDVEPEKEIVAEIISSMFLSAYSYTGPIPPGGDAEIRFGIEEARIVVLVLWQEFPERVEREYQAAVSSNRSIIVFEKTLTVNEQRNQQMKDLLRELESDAGKSSRFNVRHFGQFRKLSELKSGLVEAVAREIQRQLKYAVNYSTSRAEMYVLGTRIAESARQRLYVVQKTPILLLGAHEYTDPEDQKYPHELVYLKTLSEWAASCIQNTSRRFLYLYEAKETREQIHNFGIMDFAIERLRHWKEIAKKTSYRFIISPIIDEYSGPMTVGDSEFAFWIRGRHDANTISFVNEELCKIVAQTLDTLEKRMTLEDELELLGLNSERL